MMFKLLQFAITFGLIICCAKLFPLAYLTSNEKSDNPENCSYYITLQSTLATYPLIAGDEANSQFIKQKILQFEADITHSTQPALAANYHQAYLLKLKQLALGSASAATSPAQIVALANLSFSVIDGYYLDQKVFCRNPLYDWNSTNTRRILHYNMNGLYDQIPSKYSRILVATSTIGLDWVMGGSPAGLFVNNQATTMDTRFMTGLTLLTALYVLPQFNFSEVGGYFSVMPWSYFGVDHFFNPVIRKMIDVGGIDVFTVAKSQLSAKPIPGATILRSNIDTRFGYWVRTYSNQQSYGMAYIANHIYYEDAQTIEHKEKTIRHYFSTHTNTGRFVAMTNDFYKKFAVLQQKYDVILEAKPPFPTLKFGVGHAEIKGIVGERALFTTQCADERCLFVFNIADSPGWYALVNNHFTAIKRVNFAFMGTTVPKGSAIVWFIYQPWMQLLGFLISLISLLTLLIVSDKQLFYASKRWAKA
jgi:hypothetical protein